MRFPRLAGRSIRWNSCSESGGLEPIPDSLIYIPPRKLTWQWKIHYLKMYFPLKMVIFQCHVSFQGCIAKIIDQVVISKIPCVFVDPLGEMIQFDKYFWNGMKPPPSRDVRGPAGKFSGKKGGEYFFFTTFYFGQIPISLFQTWSRQNPPLVQYSWWSYWNPFQRWVNGFSIP